jgi:four helix bundle protein
MQTSSAGNIIPLPSSLFHQGPLPSNIKHHSSSMSSIADSIQDKCLAFSDRIIKLNDYLLKEAANAKPSYKMVKGKRVYEKAVPVHLQSVAAICNQLLRSGTSIGANNAEACNAVSKADFKSKSFIALKEARESLYWLDLLHRNQYLTDEQYKSIYNDCEELVKILVTRCKTLNIAEDKEETKK